jgi:hypothetical protein
MTFHEIIPGRILFAGFEYCHFFIVIIGSSSRTSARSHQGRLLFEPILLRNFFVVGIIAAITIG